MKPRLLHQGLIHRKRESLTCEEKRPKATHRQKISSGGCPCHQRSFHFFKLTSTSTHLKTTDIVRPECETRAGQAQSASDRLGHGLECAFTVTTPVDRESLSTGGSGSCKESCGVWSELLLDGVEDQLVVQVSIVADFSGVLTGNNSRLTCAFYCVVSSI